MQRKLQIAAGRHVGPPIQADSQGCPSADFLAVQFDAHNGRTEVRRSLWLRHGRRFQKPPGQPGSRGHDGDTLVFSKRQNQLRAGYRNTLFQRHAAVQRYSVQINALDLAPVGWQLPRPVFVTRPAVGDDLFLVPQCRHEEVVILPQSEFAFANDVPARFGQRHNSIAVVEDIVLQFGPLPPAQVIPGQSRAAEHAQETGQLLLVGFVDFFSVHAGTKTEITIATAIGASSRPQVFRDLHLVP